MEVPGPLWILVTSSLANTTLEFDRVNNTGGFTDAVNGVGIKAEY